jgi:hypothetical protein
VVCGFCPKAQHRMINGRAISAHNRNCHGAKKREPDDSRKLPPEKKGRKTTDEVGLIEEKEVVQDIVLEGEVQWIETRNSPFKEKKEDSLLISKEGGDKRPNFALGGETKSASQSSVRDFGNVNSTTYFNADINGSGVGDIVSLCQFGITEVGIQIHPFDVQYCTDVANFVHELTQSQRSDLAHILKGTVEKVKRDAATKRLWLTTIPTTPFAMRRQFWDGRSSFLDNIPHPTVEAIGQHAYTSLRECIRNRLAFGFPIEKIEYRDNYEEDNIFNVKSLMQSRTCQRIIKDCKLMYAEKPVVILLLKEWQDGYDPHAFSKSNRGSAWLKTCTISEPHGDRNGRQVKGCVVLKHLKCLLDSHR